MMTPVLQVSDGLDDVAGEYVTGWRLQSMALLTCATGAGESHVLQSTIPRSGKRRSTSLERLTCRICLSGDAVPLLRIGHLQLPPR
jgi:hypothetical protein